MNNASASAEPSTLGDGPEHYCKTIEASFDATHSRDDVANCLLMGVPNQRTPHPDRQNTLHSAELLRVWLQV